ncbi:unnamed protein product [Acidithrix sp. C25]|nr:unnamed protein product [Acidithrix sp. C25]
MENFRFRFRQIIFSPYEDLSSRSWWPKRSIPPGDLPGLRPSRRSSFLKSITQFLRKDNYDDNTSTIR